jgi:hypothetical protein
MELLTGHLSLTEDNLSFNNKYMIYELWIPIKRYLINIISTEDDTLQNIYFLKPL